MSFGTRITGVRARLHRAGPTPPNTSEGLCVLIHRAYDAAVRDTRAFKATPVIHGRGDHFVR
jgi:hypothetical protein